MIRYDLICEHGHEFDAWFASSTAYDEQAAAGLVQCPTCGSVKVRKQIMSPAVTSSPRRGHDATPAPEKNAAQQDATLLDERARALRALIHELHEHVRNNADYVGRAFAEEARKRAEEENARPVWGEASTEEVKDLLDSGMEILPLPPLPGKRN